MAGLTTFYRVCNVGDSQCKISIEQEIERYGILFGPPGERFDYSNLGYAILGEAIAHVSRESFAKVLENSVFEPLGMTHCGLGGARGAAVNYDEYSHQRSPRQISGTPGVRRYIAVRMIWRCSLCSSSRTIVQRSSKSCQMQRSTNFTTQLLMYPAKGMRLVGGPRTARVSASFSVKAEPPTRLLCLNYSRRRISVS